MSYNGLEIDMLSLGDADSTLVTRWDENIPTRVLIDGGRKGHAKEVKKFLLGRGATRIDHVVCSHPHDDHGGGLPEILGDKQFTFGKAWVHLPWRHVNMQALDEARQEYGAKKVIKILNESLETQNEIAKVIDQRKIPYAEPFEDQIIGFLKVLSPSQKYYEDLLGSFTNLEKITSFEQDIDEANMANLREILFERQAAQDSGLLENPKTEPENNSSTVLGTVYGEDVYLFTGDAGAEPLANVANTYPRLAGCRWMQIPHHGSRRNITLELIEFFRPQTAYVSACGDRKHPRRAVVNAFKEQGTAVYSTHHPSPTSLWHHTGIVPPRSDYSSASQLWN